MARFLVLQHIACEPPAAFEDELLAWGASLHRVEVDEGDPLPDWREFAGIIAMGGPMGAYEDDRLPWLTAEKRLIAEAVRAGTPYWGVCLGAQLLAASLDARAFTGPEAEVGLLVVRLTEAARTDPVFSTLPEEFVALQWHADTYDLPEGAVRLAGSDAYPQQAFVVNNAYAMQFHLEVDGELATSWGEVPAYARSLEQLLGPGALPRLVEDVRRHEPQTTPQARGMFAAWLQHVVGLPPRSADAPRHAQALELFHGLGGAGGQGLQRGGGDAQVRDGGGASLEREAPEPADGGALVAFGIAVAQDEADPQGVVERDLGQLPGRPQHQ